MEPWCCKLSDGKVGGSMVSVPGPESWRWYASCVIDKLFNLWGLHFLKAMGICACPTVLGTLNEVVHVGEQNKPHSRESSTGVSCSHYPQAESGH